MTDRWQNQEEAYQFAMDHPATMLDMGMGTGKTRVAIDLALDRKDVTRVLVVCPKAVLSVWPKELQKHAGKRGYEVYVRTGTSVPKIAAAIHEFITPRPLPGVTKFVVINYDSVWRSNIGAEVQKAGFNMVILDESHRAKAAGSKVSKFLGMLGKKIRYKLCLSGTPMANSPLDVYGQYRFLDPAIFGTNHAAFLQEYAIMGGPERRFIVGFKNQKRLHEKFQSIAYSCSMADVSQRLKLPETLPPVVRDVDLPPSDMRTMKELSKEFIAECSTGNMVVLKNVLTRTMRMQQITSGFCEVQDEPGATGWKEELNRSKEESLRDLVIDMDPRERLVVFCLFRHDLEAVRQVAECTGREYDELSGAGNSLDKWTDTPGAILGVQIQAGAEGVDMTAARYAVYYSLPHSLALYDQSKARLYRPGQANQVLFTHLVATGTIDEVIYNTLQKKKNLIDAIKEGSLDYGILKGEKRK